MDIGSRVGTRLAGYRIDSVLGRGGMGVVYLAEHLRLHRKVALKVISPDLADDERFRSRFLRESELAASIDHPNVIPVYDADEVDGVLYLAMRYVDGTDLAKVLHEQGALEPQRAAQIVSHIASALDRAHAHGLIHRDVKPGNVLLAGQPGSEDGEHVYLCDFGLGKSSGSPRGITSTGQLMGSVDYLAPEVIAGSAASAASDLYALGCLAYQCLAGAVPFSRENDIATLWAHMHEPPPPIRDAALSLAAAVDVPLRRALAKSPEDRQPTCGKFAEELSAATRPPPEVVSVPVRATATRSRIALVLAAVAVATAAAVVAAATLTGGGAVPAHGTGTTTPSVAIAPSQLASFDAKTLAPLATVPLGGMPAQVVYGARALWVADPASARVIRVDPQTHAVHAVSTVAAPTALTYGGGRVWALLGGARRIVAIAPATDRARTMTVPLCCLGPGAIAADRRHVWAAIEDTITRIAIATGKADTFRPDTGSIGLIAVPHGTRDGDTAVWVTDGHAAVSRRRSDLSVIWHDQVSDGGADGRPGAMAVAGGSVWVVATALNQVWHMPVKPGGPPKGAVQNIERPTAIAAGAGFIWVVSSSQGTLTRYDPRSERRQSVQIGGHPGGVAVAGGAVWVTTQPRDAADGATAELSYARRGSIAIADGTVAAGGDPSWSPDGSHISYAYKGRLWVAQANGSHRHALTAGAGRDSDPAWSPQGDWIAFASTRDGGDQEIYTIRPDGSRLHAVTANTVWDGAPAWSPDGATISYTSLTTPGHPVVWVVHDDGYAGTGALAEPTHTAGGAVWSPDGTELAYWSAYHGSGIYLLRLHRFIPTKLVSLPGNPPDPTRVELTWSADGRTIAILANGRVWTVYADGSGLTRTSGLSPATAIAYRPGVT
jgi:hypothetical protein